MIRYKHQLLYLVYWSLPQLC